MSIFDEIYELKDYTLEDELFIAIDANDCDRAFDLIAAEAELDCRDWFGWTPLQNCLSYEMVELLLLHGADPDQEDGRGKTVWMTGAPELTGFIERAQVKSCQASLQSSAAKATAHTAVRRM